MHKAKNMQIKAASMKLNTNNNIQIVLCNGFHILFLHVKSVHRTCAWLISCLQWLLLNWIKCYSLKKKTIKISIKPSNSTVKYQKHTLERNRKHLKRKHILKKGCLTAHSSHPCYTQTSSSINPLRLLQD